MYKLNLYMIFPATRVLKIYFCILKDLRNVFGWCLDVVWSENEKLSLNNELSNCHDLSLTSKHIELCLIWSYLYTTSPHPTPPTKKKG